MRLVILLLSALLVGQPALAQKADSDLTVGETRQLLHRYGICVVKGQRARASEALLANISNGILLAKYGRLIDGTCLPVEPGKVVKVRFQGDQYRYALADALVAMEFASQPAPVLNSVPRLDHRDPGEAPSRLTAKGKPRKEKDYQLALRHYDMARGSAYLSRYGECVVRTDPAAARALLLTQPASSEETSGFAAMRTALGTCLPEKETLNLSKLALRGTISINYYRLAHAALRTGRN
ncbi:MAG: hypothetical protein H0W92_03295 [Sphingomonas sp.]|nr:hypothetical protein [Sphingomonas sp.]